MKLNKLPKIGEGLKINGKICRIVEVRRHIDLKKALLIVDFIGKTEMLSKPIGIEFKEI